MVTTKLVGGEGEAYLIGLTDENLQRLREGKMIVVKLTECGGKDEVVLVYGKTDLSIELELAQHLPRCGG